MIHRLVALLLTASASAATPQIDAFWRDTRAALAREPVAAEVADVPAALPYREQRATLRGLDGVRFVVRIALPVQGEAPARPWPLIVTAPGYGGDQQGVMLSECQRGYVVLQVFPRSQGESAALWKIDGPDKLTWRLQRPETANYRGAYADVIRAIDYAVTRNDVDGHRIALVGTSQGGGIALAVGALDDRVTAVVAHLPFLCDVRQASRIPSRVRELLERAHRNDERALATLDYFDPLQLAHRLRIPVLVSAGGRDRTCPAATIQAVYDRLPGRKTLNYYPELAHTSCVDFYNQTWAWLNRTLAEGKIGLK